jgi:hypothetical protein
MKVNLQGKEEIPTKNRGKNINKLFWF